MAKEFFKDLPNTTTPLTASRLNGLLDGEEAMGNLVVDSIRSKNMFDKSNIARGLTYSSTGTTTNLTNSFVQYVYIPVKPNTQYTIGTQTNYTSETDYRLQILEYNSSKTFIQRNNLLSRTSTITTTANTYFVRIGASTITKNELQFEEGASLTTYAPYQNLTGITDIYTTFENQIGWWASKPLYRKTIGFTTTSTAYSMASFDPGISNADIVMIDASHSYITDTANNGIIYMANSIRPASDSGVSSNISSWFRVGDTKRINYVVGSLLTNKPAILTIEYTKTTD